MLLIANDFDFCFSSLSQNISKENECPGEGTLKVMPLFQCDLKPKDGATKAIL